MTVSMSIKPTASEIASHVVSGMNRKEKVGVFVRLTKLLRSIGNISTKMLRNAKQRPTVGALKLVTIVQLPYTLHGLGKTILSTPSGTSNERVDAVLDATSTAGGLVSTSATMAEGLAAVGAVAMRSTGWLGPVAIVGSVADAIGMVLTTKSLVETHRFSKVFSKEAALKKPVEEYTIEDFEKTQNLIKERSKEKSFIGKHFKTSSENLNSRLEEIKIEAKVLLDSENPSTVVEGKRKLQTTMQALSKRMTAKKWTNSLSLLIGSVNFIAMGLMFTPAFLAGIVIFAVTGVVSLVSFFADKAKTSRFEKELGIA